MPIHNQKTVRLTMAQAVVKYLQVQYSERNGRTRRLIPADISGIFGHGNVAGLGQALRNRRKSCPYADAQQQSMVHMASGFARQSRLATLACASSIGRGATNMVTARPRQRVHACRSCSFPPTTTPRGTRAPCCSRWSILWRAMSASSD